MCTPMYAPVQQVFTRPEQSLLKQAMQSMELGVGLCDVQYMVVYQCIVAEASMTAFFVDGSSLSNLQVWKCTMTRCTVL